MSDILDDDDVEDVTWYTTFEWRTTAPTCYGDIHSRCGPFERLERFAERHSKTHVVFAIEHRHEEECKGLAQLLRRLLRSHREPGRGFTASDSFFVSLADALDAISTGQWERDEWEWLEEHSSYEEYELLSHPRDFSLFPVKLAARITKSQTEEEMPGILLMQEALLGSDGA